MTVREFLAAHPAALAYFLWPIVTFVVSWLFKPRTPAEYAALPPKLAASLKLLASIGVDAPKAFEAVRELLSLFFPRLPPPPSAPISLDFHLDGDTDPSIEPTLPSKKKPASMLGTLFGRLVVAVAVCGWLALGAVVVACSAFSNVQAYTPSPLDELNVVEYGSDEQACLYLDASKAEKVACVHTVRCDAGREDAATCDAGAPPDAAVFGAADAAPTADASPSDASLPPSVILVHETIIRATGKNAP